MTSLIVSGLNPASSTDPTLYQINADQLKSLVDSLNVLTDIRTIIGIKPTYLRSSQSPTIWDALYYFTSGGTFVPTAKLLAEALYEDSNLSQPLLSATNHALDVLNLTSLRQEQQTADVLTKMDTIISMLSQSGTPAILGRLDTLVQLLTTVVSRLDVPASQLSNELVQIKQSTQTLADKSDVLHADNQQLLAKSQNIQDLMYETLTVPLPYATENGGVLCERYDLPLAQLLMRAMFLPIQTFRGPNHVDYKFVPYLNAEALSRPTPMESYGIMPNTNKQTAYGGSDLASAYVTGDPIYRMLLDPTVAKGRTLVTVDGQLMRDK